MRLAWARRQIAAGLSVWSTPEVLTWEAWLSRQWRVAAQRGDAPDLQLLSLSQERLLWESALQQAGAEAEDPALLRVHAPALMRAAARATQSLLQLSRTAHSEEEALLARVLPEVRRRCESQGMMSLQLAPPEALQFLSRLPPPAVAGQSALTPLQGALQKQCWNDVPLLLPEPAAEAVQPALRQAPHLDAELAACARWCLEHLQRDASARLLVLSACGDPSLQTQAALLRRHLAGDRGADDPLHALLLAVEGGESLQHQALVGDALGMLDMVLPHVETGQLLALLRSPYFGLGTLQERLGLRRWVERRGLARWSRDALREALAVGAADEPLAAALRDWLDQVQTHLVPGARRTTSEWAARFSAMLQAAAFAPAASLDSRDMQRLTRWRDLLDELAALDAVLPPVSLGEALQALRRLAGQASHQGATADAAITLSSELADPVIDYDGIWVLGLTESRWPAAPRPDPYVALEEQRRCGWPEAGVTQRRFQAAWALSRWQHRTRDLVLSFPEREGDLTHHPASLVTQSLQAWEVLRPDQASLLPVTLEGLTDQQLLPLHPDARGVALRGGAERLRVQRECAFRAQAQWRLGCEPPAAISDGIGALLRGRLLHSVLQRLWNELGTHAALMQLDEVAQQQRVLRHWNEAQQELAHEGAAWLPESVLLRERARTLRVVARVLELERQRVPFTVQATERAVQWQAAGVRLQLRLDRIDRLATGELALIDYKSGAAGTVKLHEGELDPLQLALYVAALAAAGEQVSAAALLALKPAELGFAGVAASPDLLPGGRAVPDWESARQQWEHELVQLVQRHLSGDASLAASLSACRHCHLAALCRRTGDAGESQDG